MCKNEPCDLDRSAQEDYFPKMPDLPADYSGQEDSNHFVLVSETNLTNKREQSLIFQDEIGQPLGIEDEDFDSMKTSDDSSQWALFELGGLFQQSYSKSSRLTI